MTLKIFQRGFNYSQDGPGNRLVYHLQGCNMRCPWCANPESMDISGLSTCINTCKEYEVDSIVDEVLRSKMMFFDSGGVTLTGGEPTLQFEGIRELLLKLKTNNIHTAIETNGTHKTLVELFPLIDFLIMDCKHYDNIVHYNVTGVSNENIKSNMELAFNVDKSILIRIPLINGFNATKEDAERFAHFFAKFNTSNAGFEFLPYHEYGKAKWQRCNMSYKMTDSAFVSLATINTFREIFQNNNLRVIKT